MRDLKQVFQYMNDIDYEYIVLRNWENLPESVELGDHSDLDILVRSYEQFFEIFPEAKLEFPSPRVRVKLPIGDTFIYIDVRYISDGYYPADFQQAILSTREYNPKGFWTPNPIHHRLALAYHAVHHANHISDEYKVHLGNVTVKELLEALKESGIGWAAPSDKSVGAFHPYWKGATSVVAKQDGKVIKKQTGFMAYGLIENEKRILTHLNNLHFPKVYDLDGEMAVEDCGELLTTDNLPQDWKSQLVQIVFELREAGVQHRDIKPDNLCAKDGVIKLIDFGWSRLFTDAPDSPPSCLGYPYKPSDSYDDNYSMRKIIKEFEFQLEEIKCVS